jgi:hypothetical protein
MRQNPGAGPLRKIEKWLGRKMLLECCLNAGLSVVSLFLSVIVLGFMFLLSCLLVAAVYSALGAYLGFVPVGRMSDSQFVLAMGLTAGAMVFILFTGNALSKGKRTVNVRYQSAQGQRGQRSYITYVTSPLKDVEDIIYAGPRLLLASVGFIDEIIRKLRLEVAACARILQVLLSRNSRVSFAELTSRTGIAFSFKIFPQLREIEGVVFLSAEPPGLSLTSDLRAELFGLLEEELIDVAEVEVEPEVQPEPVDPNSPHALLGIVETASPTQIKAAYRKRIKECHPDKFAGLGGERQSLAEERAKQINAAYDLLMAARRS